MLDERLSLAAALYAPCPLGADIGTDHAHLPCHLLRTGICTRMIAADVSPGALANARATLTRSGLIARADLILADGLAALTGRTCGCVSVMGIGGKTLSDILRRGAHHLRGAVLVLSAHTEQPLVRQALADIGYRIVREELCRAAGRYYVFWRAEPSPGPETPDPQSLLYGGLLWRCGHPALRDYAAWRMRVALERLRGLQSAAFPDESALREARDEVEFYRLKQEELPC